MVSSSEATRRAKAARITPPSARVGWPTRSSYNDNKDKSFNLFRYLISTCTSICSEREDHRLFRSVTPFVVDFQPFCRALSGLLPAAEVLRSISDLTIVTTLQGGAIEA